MATVVAIKEKTQTKTAMSRVMQYVMQDKKTLYGEEDNRYKLISGQNCCAETAISEFMATKKQYDKETGVYFYQYVQSFKPEENASPEKIHQVGKELAAYFKGYEVLIATHVDADHCHNHLIVNSVSAENGLKLQFNKDNLIEFRKLSDEICQRHGLSVLEPYEPNKSAVRDMNTREYRSAEKSESWKFRLINTVDKAMQSSHSKDEFIDNMAAYGYGVKWQDNYKYITYTTPDGKKCRDNKLHDEKYLKENMEVFFHAQEFGGIERNEYAAGGNTRGRGNNAETLYSNDLCSPARPMGRNGNASVGTRQSQFGDTDGYSQPARLGRFAEQYRPLAEPNKQRALSENRKLQNRPEIVDGLDEIVYDARNEEYDNSYTEGNAGYKPRLDKKSQGARPVTDSPAAEMDRRRSNDTHDIVGGVDALESLIKSRKSKNNNKEIEDNVRRKQLEQEEYNNLEQSDSPDFDDWDEDEQAFDLHL